jgi:predicted O-linked N-acetylglucosamine transferase (SPINDLY family)
MADYPHWEFLGFSYHENKNGQHAEMPKLIFLPRDIDSAQKIIAESECDLLLYLDLGMKFFSYLLAHARLAPIQCITGAHPTTSGIKNIDYFLSSAEMEIASAADHYSEKLVLLATNPGSGPTPPENISEFSKASLGLPEQGNIYLFPHNLLKCHPDHWPIFSEILERDKNAQLIFFANPSASSLGELFRNILQQNLNTHQIKRTHILTWQDQVRFCRMLELADIVLDAIYFSMGSTAYLALGLGIPVVTLATDLMRGRGTLGKYNQLEISDCITNSSAEYIELALKIAQNKAFRQILQNKIKEKNQRLKNLKPATISLGQWLEEKLL